MAYLRGMNNTLRNVSINELSKPFIKKMEEAESEWYYKMHEIKQHTIDVLQETPQELGEALEDGILSTDHPGALVYNLDCLLEVMDPANNGDRKAINQLLYIAKEWEAAVEQAYNV